MAAVVVLAVGGTTDWVDGCIARRLGQVSRLGELLDPLADRLYILATLLAFTAREVVPWQFTVALLARELLLLGSLVVLRRYGYGPPPVHYVGKTATFLLLAAFPLLLLAARAASVAAATAGAIGWGLAWWGLVLYWVAGAMYVVQAGRLVRAARARAGGRRVSAPAGRAEAAGADVHPGLPDRAVPQPAGSGVRRRGGPAAGGAAAGAVGGARRRGRWRSWCSRRWVSCSRWRTGRRWPTSRVAARRGPVWSRRSSSGRRRPTR